MNKKLILYSDGGARGNPGHAAIAVVIFENHKKIKTESKYIGIATNNQAEYEALLLGLKEALKLGANELICFLDSELVVRQLEGKYKVREEGLKDKVIEVLRLTNKFKKVSFHHVMREQNKLADKLVNKKLDEKGF